MSLVDHTHPHPHALIVLDGLVTDEGRPYQAGGARLSPANDRHFVRFHRASTCLVLTSVESRALPAVAERWSGAIATDARTTVRELRRAAIAGAITSSEFGDLVGATLDALHRAPGTESGSAPWLREVRRRLTDADELDVDEARLAQWAGVSREYLSRAFRRRYGTPLVTFRHHRRVARACALMRETPWPLAEIAAAAGFADQSHMTRAFARCLGQTPGSCRADSMPPERSQTSKPSDAGLR